MSAQQLVTITGKLGALTPGKQPGYVKEEHQLQAIVGTEGVTTTGGWAKWAKQQRRQRTSVTTLEGYDPYAITIPVLLDAAFLGKADVEQDCRVIEWFGGRGTLFAGRPGHPGEGEPPLLEVASDSELVPFWCQSGRGNDGSVIYVLDSLEFNMLGREWVPPIRQAANTSTPGRRIRQAANLNLLQYVGTSADTSDSAANRLNVLRKQEHSYLAFTVTDSINTFLKIAKHFNITDPARISEAAREIQRANSRYGASVTKPIPRGAHINVPESATAKRF